LYQAQETLAVVAVSNHGKKTYERPMENATFNHGAARGLLVVASLHDRDMQNDDKSDGFIIPTRSDGATEKPYLTKGSCSGGAASLTLFLFFPQ